MTLIYLDIDTRTPPHVIAFITECCRRWAWPLEAIRYDRTRRGWHIIIGIRRAIEPALIVCAQSIWGSDKRREMHNLARVQELKTMPAFWRARFNVLYDQHVRGVKIRNT